MGKKTVLKTKSFAFFDNSRFMTTEYCKSRITAKGGMGLQNRHKS